MAENTGAGLQGFLSQKELGKAKSKGKEEKKQTEAAKSKDEEEEKKLRVEETPTLEQQIKDAEVKHTKKIETLQTKLKAYQRPFHLKHTETLIEIN